VSADPAQQLLDAHVHFWDPRARTHAWLAAHPPLLRAFRPHDLDAGRHEVVGLIAVQADCRDAEGPEETAWLTRLARREPRIRGIVAFAPLERADRIAAHLDGLSRNPLVVGVRRLLQHEPAALMADAAFVAGVRRLAPAGLTFDACVIHEQLPALTRLARRCPEVTFVLDHLGKPDVAGGRLDPWRADLQALARRPNVACKLSGLITEAAAGWSERDVRPYLSHALDAFGPDRCMLGSDWPLVTLAASHERWTDTVLASLAELSPGERRAVLEHTAAAVYDPSVRGRERPRIERSAHAGRELHR
jgi:L-fuconolactonase